MGKTLKQQATVKTNTVPGSVCKIDAPAVKFADLWSNYVTGDPYKPAAGDKGDYSNQCALRLSATFHKIGIKMLSFSQKSIKPMPGTQVLGRVIMDGSPAAVRAYELGSWLKLQPFCGLPEKPEDITGKDWESKVKGRTGIIMFHAYWTRSGEAPASASGGHIDLWNGKRLTISGVADGFATIGRYLGIQSVRQGATILSTWSYSDLSNAKTILFWEVK
ncbi:Type VI secretion system (T6SS), amidase effector protein 4 [Duganella sacchari]|uniref:Type VI secretion system (T6SS), amidase effector protein 4 n=1 Tax=Duganella sacchari TaxID=551987 RepID=A0A1M7RFD2_9BURK|nr:type VI secretion system amidase effector protein Tae4 [Duganella sacchari]SHN44940.1 Type VI secretion system (T6SS), amidase effector protein 4 [Duganella sacchari]